MPHVMQNKHRYRRQSSRLSTLDSSEFVYLRESWYEPSELIYTNAVDNVRIYTEELESNMSKRYEGVLLTGSSCIKEAADVGFRFRLPFLAVVTFFLADKSVVRHLVVSPADHLRHKHHHHRTCTTTTDTVQGLRRPDRPVNGRAHQAAAVMGRGKRAVQIPKHIHTPNRIRIPMLAANMTTHLVEGQHL